MTAIRAACAALGTHDFAGAVLYTGCEPCPMCLASIMWARIDRVVWAAERGDAASVDFDDAKIYDEIARPREAFAALQASASAGSPEGLPRLGGRAPTKRFIEDGTPRPGPPAGVRSRRARPRPASASRCLGQLATERQQALPVSGRLHPLRRHRALEGSRQSRNGVDDGQIVDVVQHGANETLVDLQHLGGKTPQMGQR